MATCARPRAPRRRAAATPICERGREDPSESTTEAAGKSLSSVRKPRWRVRGYARCAPRTCAATRRRGRLRLDASFQAVASGVDESAMLGALQANGLAVGVLADRLLRAATSIK